MKIGELAARAGLNASAIRYYEKLGLLAPPDRAGGQRRYPAGALDRVLLIRFAGQLGFTLGETRLFLHGLRDNTPVGPRWKKLAARKIAEMQESIARARRMEKLLRGLLHCGCSSLHQCVSCLHLNKDLARLPSRPR